MAPENQAITDEELAQAFHETYERLAPIFNYETRDESAVDWEDVPESNKQLMIAVVSEIRELVDRSALTNQPQDTNDQMRCAGPEFIEGVREGIANSEAGREAPNAE